nr:type VI secretion system-associated protein TagF [Ramlibacter algicola]
MVKAARRVGWYGKLPTRGDFLGRGLPPRWRGEWDGWLQRGLALAASLPDGGDWRERLAGFAPWRYLALPSPDEAWCGIVLASRDRVGRAFPLTLAERLPVPASPAHGAARLASLRNAVEQGPEALEAAIAALPPFPATDFAPDAWPAPPCSLWWPLSAPPDAAPVASAWPPEAALLLQLLALQESPP